MLRACLLLCCALPAFADDGVRPVGDDGKPLNLDFETGDLTHWTATGDAFKDQPIKGDTVSARRNDMKSGHQGQFWIGGYEKFRDPPTGTLTSVPFKVTHRYASFLVAGGTTKDTCVELVIGTEVIHRAMGTETEELRREVVDLEKHQGKTMFVRVVDNHKGHWGHVNFDDFRFHAVAPKASGPAMGFPPAEAAARMTVPEGFTVSLFAGEPDVHQPVAFAIDDRGRLWVAEAYAYPKRLPFDGPLLPEAERKKGDRILIFDDTDGDGKFDKKTTFIEGLNLVSGLELGFGGVYVGAAPYLMFIPNKDDKPGDIQILLDGWGMQDTHETLNSFVWGPDGWLYGCHGVFTYSAVGKPGTPEKDRVKINAGIWRYHPTRHVFDVFSEGTSNPWGLDYNQDGEFFIEACVIPHCFHMIQGGRYLRQAGSHYNPHTYADINTIADHLHYIGATPHGGNNKSDAAGGGHAHCGLMCYLGGAWPKQYHGQLFMGNIHGQRINMDTLKAKGSGYVASHGPDFLLANDPWARFINFKYGPDGNVYVIDWYDKQACHRNEPEIWDRTNGRIFKVSYRGTKPVTGLDLNKCSNEELVKYQTHENEWYVRHARRIMQERAVDTKAAEELRKQVEALPNTQPLKKLWAMAAVGGVTDDWLIQLLKADPNADNSALWGWAVRWFIVHGKAVDRADVMKHAVKDELSAVVRRHLASGLQRMPLKDRVAYLEVLLSHPGDATDHNLPLLYWYALEPIAGEDPKAALDLAANGKIPMLLQFTARRIAATSTKQANELLTALLAKEADAGHADRVSLVLRGMGEGYVGRKDVPPPGDWEATAAKVAALGKKELEPLTATLAVTFGDAKAFAALRAVLADNKKPARERLVALQTLAGRDKELAPLLQDVVAEPALRMQAIRSLAEYDDAKTPEAILAVWPKLSNAEKRDALTTLTSRAAYALAMLDAIAANKLKSTDVSADVVRAMRNLPDPAVAKKIVAVWGVVADTPAARKKEIAAWKAKLTTAGAEDLGLGRALFAKTCQNCHTLYGVGGKIGPDITGSNRKDLDYLLENIFDPHAVIPKDYAQSVVALKNERIVTGIVKGDNGTALTIQTATEQLVINKGDIDEVRTSNLSLMPDDQMKPFSDFEVRSLFAYLRHTQQVPMLATADNAKELFNGKDLSGWSGNPELWSVVDGEIVGKSPGLKRNEFLKSDLAATDFRLTFKVKLTPDAGNSGVQVRSEPLSNGEMRGPQADIGAGWWGKVYEEEGRGLLAKEGGEKHVKPGEWNEYAVEAVGPTLKVWINGQLSADLKDDKLSRRGQFGLQLHSGPAMEVRFKDLKLEMIGKK